MIDWTFVSSCDYILAFIYMQGDLDAKRQTKCQEKGKYITFRVLISASVTDGAQILLWPSLTCRNVALQSAGLSDNKVQYGLISRSREHPRSTTTDLEKKSSNGSRKRKAEEVRVGPRLQFLQVVWTSLFPCVGVWECLFFW